MLSKFIQITFYGKKLIRSRSTNIKILNMKCLLVISALLVLAAAEQYSSENDDLDIEAVVGDQSSLKMFAECFNDKGPCTEQMKDFKKDVPEAVAEACAKCTPAQKHIFKRFLEVLKQKITDEYQFFKQKYDPEDKHFAALETAIANA
ncbi:unnamed protein product, partial [Brenthis ino]